MSDRIFVDTNVWIYLNDIETSIKKQKVLSLLEVYPITSPQVIFECINVCLRKFKLSRKNSFLFAQELLSVCELITEDAKVVNDAIRLSNAYQFQPFDAKIIATALAGNCNILYSEDMQHGLVVEETVTIINPFIS